jgi:hypothetical protein
MQQRNCYLRNLKLSHIIVTCDSAADRSDTGDNAYMPSEHSDQEECVHVSTPETDGDNVTASHDSDVDSETERRGGL